MTTYSAAATAAMLVIASVKTLSAGRPASHTLPRLAAPPAVAAMEGTAMARMSASGRPDRVRAFLSSRSLHNGSMCEAPLSHARGDHVAVAALETRVEHLPLLDRRTV